MNLSITHERCSELLGDYVAGDLGSQERSLVADHLAGCAAERDALVALAAPEIQPLTDGERAEVRAAVMGAATAAPGPSEVLGDERDAVIVSLGGWRSNATRYVGIAAMLAILAVGFVYIGMLGTGDSGQDAAGGGAEDEASLSDSNAGSGGGAGEDAAEERATAPGEALEDNQERTLNKEHFLAFRTAPVFEDDQGELSLDALDELSRRPVFRSFSGVYTVRQARRSIDPSLAALAETVPDELAEEVRECGRTALGDLADPGLAAYATTGSFDGRDSLVIGFVTGTRSLDRFRFVTFQLGDCRTIVRSLGGYIP